MNQPKQPAPNKYSYSSMADELKQYIKDNPDEAKKVWDELYNQPPKSAEEVLREYIGDVRMSIAGESVRIIIKAMQTYASQLKPRYVTDEEIDAMWPYETTLAILYRREGAKAMRDYIFGGVKP